MQTPPHLSDDILVIIEFAQDEHYTEYLLVQLINIYYTRKQQGLSIDSFIYALCATESHVSSVRNERPFLCYLQGVIKNILNEAQNINTKYL